MEPRKWQYLAITAIVVCCTIIAGISASTITIEDAAATIIIKPIDSAGKISKEPMDERTLQSSDSISAIIGVGKQICYPCPDGMGCKVGVQICNQAIEDKTLQIYQNSVISISPDFTNIMQSTEKGEPALELYYGYQLSADKPWRYYLRVDSTASDEVILVKADFEKKMVWMERVKSNEIIDLIKSGKMPAWADLPSGELISSTEAIPGKAVK